MDGNEQKIGTTTQDWRFWQAMCLKRYWKVTDGQDVHQYTVVDDMCCNENCCAPSPCAPVRELAIYKPDEQEVVGSLQNLFPGCNMRMFANTDSYKLTFPEDASADQKAMLLAATFLIEYQLFEKHQDEGEMQMF
jgi:hypothetical protein